jgi:hypothetical protein
LVRSITFLTREVKMAWGKNKKSNGATAGAFRTSKPGLYIASFRGKWFKAALSVFKQAAQEDEPSVVVFIRKKEQRGSSDPVFTLGLAVDKPLRAKGRIKNDPDDDPEMDDLREDDADEKEEDGEEEEEEVPF